MSNVIVSIIIIVRVISELLSPVPRRWCRWSGLFISLHVQDKWDDSKKSCRSISIPFFRSITSGTWLNPRVTKVDTHMMFSRNPGVGQMADAKGQRSRSGGLKVWLKIVAWSPLFTSLSWHSADGATIHASWFQLYFGSLYLLTKDCYQLSVGITLCLAACLVFDEEFYVSHWVVWMWFWSCPDDGVAVALPLAGAYAVPNFLLVLIMEMKVDHFYLVVYTLCGTYTASQQLFLVDDRLRLGFAI